MRAEKKMNYICFMYVKMIRLDAANDINYVRMMTFISMIVRMISRCDVESAAKQTVFLEWNFNYFYPIHYAVD